MDITTGIFILLISIFAGAYGTLVGAGGGFILVPALLIFFNLEPKVAAGTGLVIVLINSVSGVIGYSKQKTINFQVGFKTSLGAIPGSLFGVWLLQTQPSDSIYFYIIFGVMLVSLGIFLFLKNAPEKLRILSKRRVTKKDRRKVSLRLEAKWLVPLGVIMGILSSYLGIGGGWLLVPILIYIFKMNTHQATSTSIFSLCLYSTVGVISQIFLQNIDWITTLWGGIGVIVGAYMGVQISKKVSGPLIIQMLSVLLIIVGTRMFFS